MALVHVLACHAGLLGTSGCGRGGSGGVRDSGRDGVRGNALEPPCATCCGPGSELALHPAAFSASPKPCPRGLACESVGALLKCFDRACTRSGALRDLPRPPQRNTRPMRARQRSQRHQRPRQGPCLPRDLPSELLPNRSVVDSKLQGGAGRAAAGCGVAAVAVAAATAAPPPLSSCISSQARWAPTRCPRHPHHHPNEQRRGVVDGRVRRSCPG